MTVRRLVVAVQLVAFLGGAGDAWLYRCQVDRQVRARCCCPTEKPAPIPTVETGSCCSLERGAPPRETAACPAPPDRLDEAAPAVAVAALDLPARPRLPAPPRARSLGPPGPPTLLDQRTAFLL